MAMFVWLEEVAQMKEELKSAVTECGALSMLVDLGTALMV